MAWKRQNSREDHYGTLYIVATPIGNLDDITLRALKVLKQVNNVVAENISHTKGLLNHYGIRSRLLSYREQNHIKKTFLILDILHSGDSVALVTDAGTPCISDPGSYLVDQAYIHNIRIVPVPGPSALTAALSVAGILSDRYVFVGFLPRKPGKRRNILKELAREQATMVFYEAPHRLNGMLLDMLDIFGNRQAAVFKEMTKIFEDVKRGPLDTVVEQLRPEWIRGEFTVVVAGRSDRSKNCKQEEGVIKTIDSKLGEDLGIKDIATAVAGKTGISYRQAYKICVERKLLRERMPFHD